VNVTKLASKAANNLVDDLDDMLKLQAEAKGWEHPIQMKAEKGRLYVEYFEEHEQQIFDSEYGNEHVSPNAVLRPFMNSAEPIIAAEIENSILDDLFSRNLLP
jgi:hypothetical protein